MSKIQSFFDEKLKNANSRSAAALKNIMASFLVKGVSIATSLVLIPLTIHYVNPSQYGIWLTLSSIVGWISFFDIGFGNGLRNRFAEAKATGDYGKAQAYVSTTYVCLAAIFSVVCLIFFSINFLINWSVVLNAPPQMEKELSQVAIIVFSFFCLQMVLKIINTVLIADQKPAISAAIDALGQVLSLAIVYVLVQTTQGSLNYLAFALGIPSLILALLASIWFYNHDYKEYKPSLKLFDKKAARDIISLGGKFFFVQIAAIAIYQTTNIIIAQVSGTQDVTVYNIAYKYFSVVLMVSGIILTPFWSAFTDAYTLKDYSWMKHTYKKLSKAMLILCLLIIVLLFLSSTVYHLWIKDAVEIPFKISLVVALFIIFNILAGLQSNILNGIGKIKFQIVLSTIGIFINIPLAFFLGKKMGIVGVILPSLLLSIIAAICCSIQINMILNKKATGIWNK